MLQHLNYLSASIPMGVNPHSLLGPEGNQHPLPPSVQGHRHAPIFDP